MLKVPLILRRYGLALLAVAGLAAAGTAHATTCESLAKLALPQATITTAQAVAAGDYHLPPGRPEPSGMNLAGLVQTPANPAFCRVAATLKPSADSDIHIEVWLPARWNGKFLGVGNFGWGGSMMYGGMLTGLSQGYVVASTDTGHSDGNGKFALGHPQKIIDYAYRATHDMTVDAKRIIRALYGKPAAQAYMIGCSLGGLETLVEASRYPEDYDGLVVGAPPNSLVDFNAAQLWPGYLVAQNPTRMIPEAKYAVIHAAVLKACAGPVGQAQGFVDNPDTCRFDPASLECATVDGPDCLTAPQVELMRQIYAGPADPGSGRTIFPGPARGSELELYTFASGQPFANALDLFRYVAFQDAQWDYTSMDWSRDVATADAKIGRLFHVKPDLTPFLRRGGKILFYIGYNDYHNPAELAGYVTEVAHKAGPAYGSQVRLFTIPGMNHCAGGSGCDTFDKLGTIDAWVSRGQTLDRVIAARIDNGTVVRTRPLCAWPKVATYKGQGDMGDAANFTCRAAS